MGRIMTSDWIDRKQWDGKTFLTENGQDCANCLCVAWVINGECWLCELRGLKARGYDISSLLKGGNG